MAVVIDPGRLDPHHRGDERGKEQRFENGPIEHAGYVREPAAARPLARFRWAHRPPPIRTKITSAGSRLSQRWECAIIWVHQASPDLGYERPVRRRYEDQNGICPMNIAIA